MSRIMIVDDAIFMRTMLKNIIEEMGLEVVCEASTGVEAIELYTQYLPDLVTMDITMPDMDGYTAVTHILKLFPEARIIMCSAVGQQRIVLNAITAGARDFIVKPFEKARVKESILTALNK
ncbi:MAG: response regulator receiver protein [Bacilli bacterium]|jgi:two-component system chemotaxis response regulator CheY|nr:response regulator receiver protein [Bacilli bacterium]